MLTYHSNLRESAFSTLVFEHLNAGCIYINFATNQYALSGKMQHLMGMATDSQLPDLHSFISKIIHPEDWGVLLQFINNDLKLRNNRCEVKILHANACYNWYETVRQITTDEKGATVELWLSFTNIDLLKKLQQRCARLMGNAGIAEDVMGIGFWEFDVNSGEQYFSASVYDMFALEYSQNLNCGQMLECLANADKEKVLNAFETMMGVKSATDLALQLTNLKGERLWVRLVARPQLNKQGSVVKIHGILQDISKDKKAAIVLEKLSDELLMHKENLKEIKHLVSNHLQSHTSHLAMIANMINAEHNMEVQPEWLNQIKKVTTHLSTTVSNLANHLNFEFNNGNGKKQLFFKDLFDKAAKKMNVNISDAYNLVDADFSNCQSINCEPKLVENVMVSLMKNAMRYKHPGKKPVLSVKTFLKDNQYCMQISDNGSGIDLRAYSNQQTMPLAIAKTVSETSTQHVVLTTAEANKINTCTLKFN